MKTSRNAWIIGIVAFIALFIGGISFGGIPSLIIPGGNDFQNSYFYPLYSSVILLIAIVISCSYIIITKLNQLLEEKDDSKKE